MAFLEIENLHKSFGANVALHQFDMKIERGEFVTFLGPSGCGKTTVLRMIAGFESPTRGVIRLDGHDVTHLRTRQRKVGMVFQSYALFPNMTVADNIGFGLRVARQPQEEIRKRVDEMLELIKLSHVGERYPWQLSGGQQQRVALARALAGKPQVLLLDEPLSALDAKIRISLRQDIRALQRELGITSIFVTHDQEEALSISDRVVVMNEGRVEQVGTSSEIYNYPRTRFVASFVGTLNILSGHVVDPASGKMAVDGQELVTSQQLAPGDVGKKRLLALRPEAIVLEQPATGRNTLAAIVEEVNFLGAVVRIRTRVKEAVISLDVFNDPNRRLPERGQPVALGFSHENLLVLEEAC
ncbi:ABC transporter ATP-binding protein [Paraburkholderia nemoris]|jgi:putative spermidine/putrescine transport system ATP-binding protein|uniref:Spermidine/putrescine import ATP-binding protein PotA n=1 Tax=Paraburkholderia nemoris TaxID=2793076 RepID=A0ABM8QX21_9BURK|nr:MULTISPECIES: ABC transporter ATP-binding protein [Paraburkholderia]MBK3809249.1 ABC transporter ATP-binding protein [Paraburkholderia aspalathi]CAE6720168.1 Spermidine/putrescine import ATP-binding protein PotA [Paraburkholderia nemoris]CAE6722742.1 Spermidine/putrescine import ATP-binding protein PotA [Paraburkholderia nemoris]